MALVFEQQQEGVRTRVGPREILPAVAEAVFKGKGDDQVCFSGVLDLSAFGPLDPIPDSPPKSNTPTQPKKVVNADDNQVSFSGALDLTSFGPIDENDEVDLDAISVSDNASVTEEEQESPSSIPSSYYPNPTSPGSCHSEPRGPPPSSHAPYLFAGGNAQDPFVQRRRSFDEPTRPQTHHHRQQQQQQQQQRQLFPPSTYQQQQPSPLTLLPSPSPLPQLHNPYQQFPLYKQPHQAAAAAAAASPDQASHPRQNRVFLPKPATPLYSTPSSACPSPDHPLTASGAPAPHHMPSPPPAYSSSGSGVDSPFNMLFPGGSPSGSPYGSPGHPRNPTASPSPVYPGSTLRCPSLREQVLMRTSSTHSTEVGCPEGDAFSDAGSEVDWSDIYSECFNFADVEACCQDKELDRDVVDGISLVPLPMHFSTPGTPEYVLYALYFSSDKGKPVLPGDDSTKLLFPQKWQAAASTQPPQAVPRRNAGLPSLHVPSSGKAFAEYKTYRTQYS